MARRVYLRSTAALLVCCCLSGWPAPPPAAVVSSSRPLRVALTRQAGENAKLRKVLVEALAKAGIDSAELVELPCIEHARGPDFEKLQARLPGAKLNVLLTSPEAARVFADALSTLDSGAAPSLQIASVGKGTTTTIEAAGLSVAFQPSLANSETLAAELPEQLGSQWLYAASAIAPGTLQEGLEQRGFKVERLDSYTTQPVSTQTADALALMDTTDVATFGSPSAVRAWADASRQRPLAACIGHTSRTAAEAAGFANIYAPEQPGIAGWAEATMSAIRRLVDVQDAA